MTVETTTGFTQVPNEILTDARLTAPSRLLYSILKSYAWQTDNSFPGQVTLAEQMGCSDRMIRSYLLELEDSGLVTVEQRGKMTTNKYFLTDKIRSDWKPISASDRKHTSTHRTSDRKQVSAMSGSTVPVMTGSTLPTNNTHANKTQIKNTNTPLPPREKPAVNQSVVDDKFLMRKKLQTLLPANHQLSISPATSERFHKITDMYPLDWVQVAFDICADGSHPIGYLIAILDHWQAHGFKCACRNPKAVSPGPIPINRPPDRKPAMTQWDTPYGDTNTVNYPKDMGVYGVDFVVRAKQA